MIDKFVADTEKLLRYISRIEVGELICIRPAERLAKEQGLGDAWLREAVQKGVGKKISSFLERIREGEDIEVYTELVRELARDYGVELAELEDRIDEAVREAEVRRFNYYVNMIENENIHLIGKARAIQQKYGIESRVLEEAIARGEYAYLLNNIKQIRKGPRFHPLLAREERVLRGLARKYGREKELEEAIRAWREQKRRPEE